MQARGPAAVEGPQQRAAAIYGGIQAWLSAHGANQPTDASGGVSAHDLRFFLKRGWSATTALTADEESWILSSWPTQTRSANGQVLYYSGRVESSGASSCGGQPLRAAVTEAAEESSPAAGITAHTQPTLSQAGPVLASHTDQKPFPGLLERRLGRGAPAVPSAASDCTGGAKVTLTVNRIESGSPWQQQLLLAATHIEVDVRNAKGHCVKRLRGGAHPAHCEQTFPLELNLRTHADVFLSVHSLEEGGSCGRHRVVGFLRLPVNEMFARGSHEGWFALHHALQSDCKLRDGGLQTDAGSTNDAILHMGVQIETRPDAQVHDSARKKTVLRDVGASVQSSEPVNGKNLTQTSIQSQSGQLYNVNRVMQQQEELQDMLKRMMLGDGGVSLVRSTGPFAPHKECNEAGKENEHNQAALNHLGAGIRVHVAQPEEHLSPSSFPGCAGFGMTEHIDDEAFPSPPPTPPHALPVRKASPLKEISQCLNRHDSTYTTGKEWVGRQL